MVVTAKKVLSLVEKYNKEYGAPASVGDIVFELIPEEAPEFKSAYDKIEEFFKSEKGKKLMERVSNVLLDLVREGKMDVIFGGYVVRKEVEALAV